MRSRIYKGFSSKSRHGGNDKLWSIFPARSLFLICLLIASVPARAETTESAPIPHSALVNLARQFVDRVGGGFEEVDNFLLTPRERMQKRYAVDIPDGELLLLQIELNRTGDRNKKNRLRFNEPVVAIKQGKDVMISLTDLFNVAQFAIEVKPAQNVAEGWYIRKNQTFRLDTQAMTATANGKEFQLAQEDIAVQETDILMRRELLEEIFDFESTLALGAQFMSVQTKQKWPALEHLERLRRRGTPYLPPPELPLQEEPYDMVSVPNANISTSRSFSRSGEGAIGRSSSYRANFDGDLIGHTARILSSGSLEPGKDKLDTLKATFKRESDKPDLLGWMGAHKYEFGDIGSGIGIRATNRNPYVTADPITVIEGDIAPGWDVELYRGNQYMGSITNSEGTYRFEDVPLAAGANPFRITKFGPLGEVEEEEITVYSTPSLRGVEGGLYNVQLAAAATDLWTRKPKESPDKYTPVFDGNYQWALNDITSLTAGLSTSQQQREQKTFPSLGVASFLGDTLVNANVVVDVDGSWTGGATARRPFLGQNISANASYTAEDFGAISGAEIPSRYSLSLSSHGRIPGVSGTYAAGTDYSETDNGSSRQKNSLNLSSRIGKVGISTGLEHTIRKSPDKQSETVTGFSALSGKLGRTSWRAGADYNISPGGLSMESYNLNLIRGLAKDVGGYLTIQNSPATDFTSGTATVTWSGKYARVSPSISYDTENNLVALLTSSFGVAYNSYGKDIIVRGKDLSKFGAVSAFVYLDKNGDNIFSEGDEPIQDAIVEAIHAHINGTTNEEGEAFLYDLPANIITDVKLNEYSFFDPLMVSGFKGVSVMPRAGHDARIEFPVHNGGEMDGTIYIQPEQGAPRALRSVRLYLYDMDGRLENAATSSFDGLYLFQKIHPGKYYLIVDDKDVKNFGLVQPFPEVVTFGYEGTVVYGHDIILNKTKKDNPDSVPMNIGTDIAEFVNANPTLDPALLKGKPIMLNLGAYRSNLLATLVWYKLKTRYNAILGNAALLVDPAESFASGETGLHTLRVRMPGYDIQGSWQRCRALIARGLYCSVEIMPQQGERKEAAAANAPPKT